MSRRKEEPGKLTLNRLSIWSMTAAPPASAGALVCLWQRRCSDPHDVGWAADLQPSQLGCSASGSCCCPEEALRLSADLVAVDIYLDDERFIAPWRVLFSAPPAGRQDLGRAGIFAYNLQRMTVMAAG